MKKCALLALMAGAAWSGTAVAQDLVYVPEISARHRVSPVGYPGRSPGGYEQRDILPVYDTLTGGGYYLASCAHMLDDVGFANGPWSRGTMPQLVTELTYSVYIQDTNVVDEQNLVIIWDQDDVNFEGFGGTGTNMIRPGATPLAVIRVNVPAESTLATEITVDLTGLPGGGVLIPADDDGCYIDVSWITNGFVPSTSATSGDQPDWSNLSSNASGGIWGGRDAGTGLPLAACPFPSSDRSVLFGNKSGAPLGGNPAVPGFSRNSYGRDIASPALDSSAAVCTHIGRFIGNGAGPASSGAVEHRRINDGSDAYAYRCQLKGDVIVTPPVNPVDLGCIPDALTTTNSSVATGGVKWFSLCLTGDVQDAFLQFLDIDTEGSATDVDIALYRANGSVIAVDRNDGSGNNAQISCGVGLRAAVGDGRQYNGRDGQFLAGNFFVGVAPAGSQFNFGFDVTSAGTGGSFRLRTRTNVNSGALDPSVAPAGIDLGDVSNGTTTGAIDVPRGDFLWFSFTTNFDTATTLDRYVDIAFDNDPAAGGDTEAFIFNGSGVMIATNDDDGPPAGAGSLSQFSFSHPSADGGPADRASTGDRPFGGQDGELPAGTYYLAVGVWDVLTLTANDRFHLRATNNTDEATFAFRFSTGAPPACPPCAADFNQDGGVDGGDIESFFGAWEGGDTCGDVNQDGGVDGGDIESFFLLWEAGGC